MALYTVYNFSANDSLQSVADAFHMSVDQLAQINNIQPPFDVKLYDLPYLINNQIYVIDDQRTAFPEGIRSYSVVGSGMSGAIGFASQGKCSLAVEGVGTAVFPCFPDSYSDSHSVSYASQTPLGRSEPFQIYQNTGPRTVSVSFRMHREMTHTTSIGDCVAITQAALYPTGGDQITPRSTLTIGSNCSITGIVTDVSANWSETINKATTYNVVDLSFSVVECTGNPKMAGTVAGLGGR